jgi:vanillate O-demethylase monooxygenase subunit
MGDIGKADASLILQIENWDNPAWGVNSGESMTVDCNYLYVTDNLLDPTHVAWVHQTSFGTAACEDAPLVTVTAATGVTVSRWISDSEPAPFYAPFLKFAGNCDRQQYYEVRYPAHAIIKAVFVPAGTGGEGRPLHEDAFMMDSYNFMTPVTENQTKYYWFQMRNFAPGDSAVSEQLAASVRDAFLEDRTILKAVHDGMANKRTSNIDFHIDKGPLHFRRAMARLIAAEHDDVRNPQKDSAKESVAIVVE